ncbi:MAG TPA: translocation/assembly module TamB domain-containing protein [Allosphingosinicella sp.]|jgi:translocation and assembly module TamB
MAEAIIEALAPAAPERVPRRPVRWWSALAKFALSFVAVVMLMLLSLGLLLDTDLGHRLILDRVAAMTPSSGFRIRIGRIEGSIWGRTELRDVRLYDLDGLWAEAPRMRLDWRPFSWLFDRLVINEIGSELAIVHRLPRFEPPSREEPPLPDYDVHIGRFDFAQLRFEPAVAGARRAARLVGEAEFRRGRFLLDLDGAVRGSGDRLALRIDAAPERDQLDLDLALAAPTGGVLARLFGLAAPLQAEIEGAGSWRRWDGRGRIASAGREAGDIRIAARSGRYGAAGWIDAGPLFGPRLAALAGGRLDLRADGRFDEGVLDGRFTAASPAARFSAEGAADLRRNLYDDLRADLLLLRPLPLLEGAVAGAGSRLTLLANGPFADAAIAYRVAAPRIEIGGATFETLAASGSGRRTGGRLLVPLAATARRVTAGGTELLANVRLGGTVRAEGDRLSGDGLTLASDRLRARFGLQADLGSGRAALAGTAASDGYEMPGVGRVDISGDWRVASGSGGFTVAGGARGIVRRFDNAALEWAAGGPLRFQTEVAAAPDGAVQLPALRLSSPRLQLSGRATRRADGALAVEGSGRQSSLGPLSLSFDGSRLSLRLARPSPSLGLADVRVEVVPAGAGFGYSAAGRSLLGPFAARGTVAAPGGRAAALQVASLNVSGASASGVLRPAGGGLSGRLDFRGSLSGPLTLAAEGGAQHLEASLVARDARLGRVPIGSGRIEAALTTGVRGGGLAGHVRLHGAADRLWAMTGVSGATLSGPFSADVLIGGTVEEPGLSGTVQLDRGRFLSSAAGTAIDGIEARASFSRDRLVLESLAGRTEGGGRISASGLIGFGGALDLRIDADGAQLFDSPELRARATGPIRIQSSREGGTISGALRLSRARIRIGSEGADGGGGAPGAGGWRLALRLDAERVDVEGRGLDSRWRAALRLGGTTGAPALTGEAVLLSGSYRVLGRAFELSRGRMVFAGESPPDPRLDIVARPPGGSGAAVHITGRASRPEIGIANPLTSDRRSPALPPRPGGERALRPRARHARHPGLRQAQP